MAIFITKMKRLWHHIIFITGILMLVKRNIFIETDPSCPPIPSQCDEFENQASVAEIYGHWIFKWVSVFSLHTMHQDSSPINDQKDYMLNLDSSRPSMSAVFIIRSYIYIYINIYKYIYIYMNMPKHHVFNYVKDQYFVIFAINVLVCFNQTFYLQCCWHK